MKSKTLLGLSSLCFSSVALLCSGLVAAEEFEAPFPEGKRGGLVFTLDDGTVDQYEVAAPVLEKYGLRAIFNIIPSRIGEPNMMTWDQVRDLVKRGHALGNHTMTHPNLNRLAETGGVELVRRQLVDAYELIKKETGYEAKVVCFPYNANGPVSERIIKENGYQSIAYRMSNWGGKFAAKEAHAAAEKSIASGRCDYILMHGFRPGGGWAPLNDPAQFEEIVKALVSHEDLWLPTYDESVARREGVRRRQNRLKYEGELLGRYAPIAVRAEVEGKGGWDAVRTCGEKVAFKVSIRPPSKPEVLALLEGKTCTATLDNFGAKKLAEQTFVFSTNAFVRLEGTLDEPGFLRLSVKVPRLTPNFGDFWQRSVAFESSKLKPARECPADFDAFWKDAVSKAEQIPLDPQMKLNEKKSQKDHDFYEVSFATLNDRRVYGYLLVPKNLPRPMPLRVQVPGAGVGGWSLWPHGRKDCALLFMTVFPWAPGDDTGAQNAQYRKMTDGFKAKYGYNHYFTAGLSASREAEFYYPVILGINRAVDWVASREEFDASKVGYYGISQGGGFGLYLAMLNKTISRFVVNVPGFSDLQCDTVGRQLCVAKNFYNYDDPAVAEAARKNAPYFDTANFASRVTRPIRFVTGQSDWVCPPATVCAAYNVCPSTDKALWVEAGDHNGAPASAEGRANQFLKFE